MAKKQKEEFQMLTHRQQIHKRPQMYVGGTSFETIDRYLLGKKRSVTYVPGLLKLIDEITDNCIDEHIRTGYKKADIIDVKIKGNRVTIQDNGRGIPHSKVETPEGDKILQPLAAWTRTNAGSSFGDDRTTIGANGVGSALVGFFASDFVGTTWRDWKEVEVTSKDGGNPDIKNNPKGVRRASKRTGSGTIVDFEPDFKFFECDEIDETIHYIVQDRLISLAVCFPKVTFRFNGRKVGNANFDKYLKMYGKDNVSFGDNKNFSCAFIPSTDGYSSTSFVNGVNTIHGGSYVDYIVDEVCSELIPMLKRMHKITITKKKLKDGFTFILFVNNFVNPKFNSQTKEKLTNTLGEVKEHFNEYMKKLDFKKVAKQIASNKAVIDPIIKNELAAQIAADERDAKKDQKNSKKVNVAKHVKAQKKGGDFYLVEGDSAAGYFGLVRNKKTQGCLPLRGVVMNVWEEKVSTVTGNKEMSEIISCIGLDIFNPDSVDNTYYHNICILVDADVDGNHIAALLYAFFYKYWPRLYEENRIRIIQSPILITKEKGKKKEHWTYEYSEIQAIKNKYPKAKFRYIKGLGSLKKEEYKRVITDPVYKTIKIDDEDVLRVMFVEKDSDDRKKVIMGEDYKDE